MAGVDPLTPRMVRVRIAGPGLVGLRAAGPDQRVKLSFPEGSTFGEDPAELGRVRRRRRTYTLLDLDPVTGTAVVDFVLHGGGIAGGWAARARVGDEIALTEPVGRFDAWDGAGDLHLVADETGLPALRAIAAEQPPGRTVRAYVEVHDDAERQPLPGPARMHVTWLARASRGAEPGSLLAGLGPTLAAHVSDPSSARVWIAGEAGAVRALRAFLLTEAGFGRADVTAVAYWKLGAKG